MTRGYEKDGSFTRITLVIDAALTRNESDHGCPRAARCLGINDEVLTHGKHERNKHRSKRDAKCEERGKGWGVCRATQPLP